MKKKSVPVPITNYRFFMCHTYMKQLADMYERHAIRAENTLEKLYDDLVKINAEFYRKENRTLFTIIDGRVKEKQSFFKKLFKDCKENSKKDGCTEKNIAKWYTQIHDLAGMRFSCPYYDEVLDSINKIIKPKLQSLGYGIDLTSEGIVDKDFLDEGDKYGYRSYHFFLKVPTPVDIYGNSESVVCEVQGRSELQHVWAVKSHDLMYKLNIGWRKPNDNLKKDMKELSNHLRAVDHFLVNIRKQVRGK